MKSFNRIILAILSLLALHAQALTVTTTAGSLSTQVTDMGITSLTVSGTMNAEDFYFIADNLKQLQTLDLTAVTVVASNTASDRYWQDHFADNELPVGALGGLKATTVKLPSGLKSIGKAAMAGCTNLTSLTMPATLDSIGDYAFAGCTSLPAVMLPANVKVVGAGAFMRCTSLTRFEVEPSSHLSRLDATALMDCPALTTISPGAALRIIGERAMAGSGITQLDLTGSTSLTEIGDWAMVLTPVTEARLPKNLTHLGDGAFLYDQSLASISLGGKVTELSDYLLAGTGLNIGPDLTGVTTIGDYAFYNTTRLSVVELPATLTWMGAYAMAGMTGMTALTSNAVDVPALGENVWAGVKQRSIPLTVPAESKELYQSADQWKEFLFEKKWLRGDVNNDGEVNIADINTLIDIILGGKFDDDTMLRADVNEDGEINIADINTVIDIILNPGSYAPAVVDTDDALHIDDLVLRPGEQRTINVMLDNAATYSALQCDIVLPQGLTLVATNAVQGQASETRAMDEASARTLLYSLNKRSFNDNQAVLTITVLADAALTSESQITVSNIVLADDNNVGWHAANCIARVSNSTGIEDLTADADRVWIEGRTLCIDSRHAGTARVSAINGVTSDLDITVGVTRHDMEPGFYIVIVNNKSHKIAIK